MVRPCKFWPLGQCKFGDSCRFEHSDPGPGDQRPPPNRYAPLSSNSGNQGPKPATRTYRAEAEPTNAYNLTPGAITYGLIEDRPIWILSAFGPGTNAPVQLFGGPTRETSFEELRLRHYELSSQGLQEQAVQEAQQLYNNADEQCRQATSDPKKAVRYILDGESQHPNRHDIITASLTGQMPASSTSTGGFGQPTQLGQTPAFGQPSAVSTGFGMPSGAPAFGQTTAPQSNLISDKSRATVENPFGRPTQQTQTNPFASATPQANPFAQAATQQTQANPFARAPSTGLSNPFGQQSLQSQGTPFSTTATNNQGPQAQNSGGLGGFRGFGGQGGAGPVANSPRPAMARGNRGRRDGAGKLISWDGRPVKTIDGKQCFQRRDGEWERIVFPNPPQWRKPEDLPLEFYNTELEEEYNYFQEHGVFKEGVLPEFAPKRAWVGWEF